jgi:hypothetical protein
VKYSWLSVGVVLLSLSPQAVFAMPSSLNFRTGHFLWTISTQKILKTQKEIPVWYYRGTEAIPPPSVTEGVHEGWTTGTKLITDLPALSALLQKEIGDQYNRPPGRVIISRNASGALSFSGAGLLGRTVEIDHLALMTMKAISENVSDLQLPVQETQPFIDVQDEELKRLGIREVVSIGESSFKGSPINRRHNINVGIHKFNGHLIAQGETFSFVKVLGPVNAKTGYRKELVIRGEKTIPDYGGGLCQVSSTAYRAAWEYGLPITKRKNHSYAVGYYSPQGTDATIYPPNVDLQFTNDTPGALLMQTLTDASDHVYFIYYGTKDARRASLFGPFVSATVAAPKQEKIVYSLDLKPGEKRKNGERHDGKNVTWYRVIQKDIQSEPKTETFFSSYEARPLFYEIGVTPEEMAALTSGEISVPPNSAPTKN